MTLLSCLAIGLAFLIAIGLLVIAGSLIGFSIPLRIRRRPLSPRRDPAARPDPSADSKRREAD